MPRTKKKPSSQADNGPLTAPAEVLTLADAAAYLRVTPKDVLLLVREQSLPGRPVGPDWRFLKSAIQDWLRAPAPSTAKDFWQRHFGALKDDPYLEQMLEDIYKQRGRPETEEQ
jgi:excisionase family DNA binding protein